MVALPTESSTWRDNVYEEPWVDVMPDSDLHGPNCSPAQLEVAKLSVRFDNFEGLLRDLHNSFMDEETGVRTRVRTLEDDVLDIQEARKIEKKEQIERDDKNAERGRWVLRAAVGAIIVGLIQLSLDAIGPALRGVFAQPNLPVQSQPQPPQIQSP